MNIRKAVPDDAGKLAALMKETFDTEMRRWLPGEEVQDSNLRPPGYDSIEQHRYAIRESEYYVLEEEAVIIGGASIQQTGRHARVDKIFIDPLCQGRGYGSILLAYLEEQYPEARAWKLETSSRQLNNHRFYEKAGYTRIYESHGEFGYEKLADPLPAAGEQGPSFIDRQLSQAEFENCVMSGADFYNINLAESSFNNSNLSGCVFTDSNLQDAKFTNLNLCNTLIADSRLSGSEIALVALDGVYIHDTSLGTSRKPAVFERCDLSGSHFLGCDLTGVILSQCDLSGMRINGIPVEELQEAYVRVNKA
ncbi:GNAT family N-acetyltransferase [Paenibacillus sp. MMS20-IR301]|uniref:GNAT family N-acetyltransferase n=1 Tax=Paenibacillus sp. MMS20-IR301 TaxID=2895946 RepID=UPI0028E2BE7E|nr:GNAT family N-acetyltransferase [Paenibacillus sp. MMS20-IR301]WNS46290.1 GNAT family N-acetyltransferase [Paenibacillus sp. MMS20-IR301]